MNVNVVLYDNFTALDVFGPVEVLSRLDGYRIQYYSLSGGIIGNEQSVRIDTEPMECIEPEGIFLIPGGFGSRIVAGDGDFISVLKKNAIASRYVLCVCTGSALLACTGLLDGKRATSNKTSFEWVKSCGAQVQWVREARWIVDDKYYTSAGVSAGMDMALGFVRDMFGDERARAICQRMEYHWNEDADHDMAYDLASMLH